MKPLAIISADWHCHKFSNFNVDDSRLKWTLLAGHFILKKAAHLKVPHLFCGDLIHSPKEAENETITSTFNLFRSVEDVTTYAISGNHDMSEKNGGAFKSPSWLNMLYGHEYFKKANAYKDNKMFLKGIDYHNDNEQLYKAVKEYKNIKSNLPKILMLHSDMPGAHTPEGIELEEAYAFKNAKLDKIFKEWDLVICGHIHLPQKLSKKVYMIGPPIHQTISDAGYNFGYWILYDDLTLKHIHLPQFPKFIKLPKGEKPPLEQSGIVDYYITEEEEITSDDLPVGELFNIDKSRKILAQNYMKVRGINSKAKKIALIKALSKVE